MNGMSTGYLFCYAITAASSSANLYVLGVALASTSQVLYGQIYWNPTELIKVWDNRPGKFVAGLLFAFAGATTIILTDYFFVRHASGYNVSQLYTPRGLYWYSNGVNWRAIVAFFCGMLPLLPGLVHQISPRMGGISRGYVNFTSLTWLDSTTLACVSYYILYRLSPFPTKTDAEDEMAWAIHREGEKQASTAGSQSERGDSLVIKRE
ncbi:MAG: hypothetical protein Q9168_001013 [Polycauliona sp. 1 TL-2023]